VQLPRIQGSASFTSGYELIDGSYPCADTKVVYRRYASLFFVTGIGQSDNELVTLEIIHRYVEVLDRYFGNVRNVSRCSPFSFDEVARFASSICEFFVRGEWFSGRF